MATANCNVLLKLEYDYKPSVPITSSTAVYKYRIKNSQSSYTELTKNPAPISEEEVSLPNIQSAGEYELKVELNVNGATDEKIFFFQVDNCNLTSCKDPSIEKVYFGVNDQIIMDYTVDNNDFDAVEYQIATDSQFHDIIHFRVVLKSDYNPTEYIEMNDGTIPNETKLFIRARKHCSSSGVSAWSDVFEFTSGKWGSQKDLDANCLANFDDLDRDICFATRGYAWKTKVTLNTSIPNIGSLIYLTNGKLAIPENIKNLDQSVDIRFKNYGIRWIRFSSVTPNVVYVVDPEKAEILGTMDGFDCSAT